MELELHLCMAQVHALIQAMQQPAMIRGVRAASFAQRRYMP